MSEYKGYTQQQKIATNKYIKNNKDRLSICMDKGTKEQWRKQASTHGMSLTAYIAYLIEKDK